MNRLLGGDDDNLENNMLEQDREEPMVLPEGPWRVYWQGSGPERGDHIMCGRDRVAYLPAPDGTEGLHEEAGRIVYEHNCAIARATARPCPDRVSTGNCPQKQVCDYCQYFEAPPNA